MSVAWGVSGALPEGRVYPHISGRVKEPLPVSFERVTLFASASCSTKWLYKGDLQESCTRVRVPLESVANGFSASLL